jgi:solute carrier family 25 phosphate transporter 23/24/25/41
VLSYFQATTRLNPEGDVEIGDDTAHGLGTSQKFLHSLLGSIFLVAKTPSQPTHSADSYELPLPAMTSQAKVRDSAASQSLPPRQSVENLDPGEVQSKSLSSVLIACVPHAGYFVAGGLAGIVSRTSTAPLDRLKVYLIAQTGVAQEAVAAAKSGHVLRAATNAWRPLYMASHELWQAGGMRSLYAGKLKMLRSAHVN